MNECEFNRHFIYHRWQVCIEDYFWLPNNQIVYNVLSSMLARVGRLDPQQLLHLSLSNGSILCIPYFLISHFTLCSHVYLGLPLHPWTSNLRHFDTQSSTSFLYTWARVAKLVFSWWVWPWSSCGDSNPRSFGWWVGAPPPVDHWALFLFSNHLKRSYSLEIKLLCSQFSPVVGLKMESTPLPLSRS